MGLPLAGVSIAEAVSPGAPPALAAAIGFCGRIACDLGADIVRWDPGIDADDATAAFLHTGKRGMRANCHDLLATLAATADAAIIDIGLEGAFKPPPVCAILSMDGTNDPLQSEFTVEARSALLNIVGDPGRQPLRLAGHQTAYAAGLAAFTALIAGLAGAEAATIRVSLLETALWLNWKGLAIAEQTGKSPERPGAAGEWPVLRCADGYVALVYRFQEWQRLLEAFPDPALRAEKFQTPEGRRANRVEINAILQQNVALLTRAMLHALALRHKLPFGPVWRPDELRHDTQMQARRFFAEVAGGLRPLTPVLWNGQRLAPESVGA